MAKLIALALAFTALVAFASAHSTIVTTTIKEESPFLKQQCSQQLQGQRFNQCQRYLAQGQSWYEEDNRSQKQGGLQLCCQELQYVDEQCQCEAVKEAFRDAQKMQQQQQQQQGQQGGSVGSKQIRQMMQKAQNLPNQCNLQTRQCQVGKISITTFTTITEDTSYNRRGSQSQQQCEHIRGRQFNQCQSFIQRQMGSYGTLLMSVGKQGLELCCNELQNVEEECQCQAVKEVYMQAQKQQQQGSQQRGRRGGQPQTQDLQQIVQNLPNQCKLEVQQCRIPSAMF